MNLEKFAAFLKELRTSKNLSHRKLAELLHVHRTTVVKWEKGKALPLNDSLLLLSDFFDVSIDELIAGERITPEVSNDKRNSITLSLLSSRRKWIRITKYSVFITIILLVVFLIYYFFTTYNSIHVYLLRGSTPNVNTRDNLLIVSNEKVYLKLGSFYNNENEVINIENVKLFIDEEDNTNLLFSGDSKSLLVEYRDNIEIFKYNNFKNKYDNLYLVINYNNEEEIIQLDAEKDFENKSIINLIKNTIKHDNNKNIVSNVDNFKIKDGNVEIGCFTNGICKINITRKDYAIEYTYNKSINTLAYKKIINNDCYENEFFSIDENMSEKEEKIYNEFKSSILDKYLD